MVLKPAKVDKALVLGDTMAMIEVIEEVRSYTLNNIYVPPEKMIKLHHPASKISQLWLSRLKPMKTSKYFSLKVLCYAQTAILAEFYDLEGEYASNLVSLSTLICLFTIPVYAGMLL